MHIYTRKIIIKRNRTYLIARTNENIIPGQVYQVRGSEHYFKVIEIETVNDTICDVTLEQHGNRRYFITTSKEAMNTIHDEIILVTDEAKLKELDNESCY